jgi:hypothetical protein
MPKKVTIREEKILDNWSVLIEGGHGRAEDFYNAVVELIRERDFPGLKLENIIVQIGERTGIFGKFIERDYLRVLNEQKPLKDFRIYVGARDYGKDLNVCWYLTCEPGLFSQLLGFTSKGYGFEWKLKMFAQEDLTAYVTSVHHSILKAVETLMRKLGQDFSKIDRKSKGFLGVS